MRRSPSRLALTAERYEHIAAFFRRRAWAMQALIWGNRICAMIFYLSYPACMIWMLYTRDYFIGRALLIPAVSFIVLSIFRKWLNRPRPYERLNIRPLLHKKSKGKSFPSRHIFSAFMIAATLAFAFPWGIVFYLPAIILAFIRVAGGVHYPSDVLAGAGFALLVSLFYYI